MRNQFNPTVLVIVVLLAAMLFTQGSQYSGYFPQGGLIAITTGTCPSGFTEVSALNGKMLIGTLAANGNVGGTGGADSITPTGTVSVLTFTGNNITSSAVSGGTPAGTIGALTTGADSSTTGGVAKAVAQTPVFTGSALGTHTHTTTATGTISQPTFTGSAFDNHPTFTRVIFCSKN